MGTATVVRQRLMLPVCVCGVRVGMGVGVGVLEAAYWAFLGSEAWETVVGELALRDRQRVSDGG